MTKTIRHIIAWFKVRFIFTTEQLQDTIYLIDRVDRQHLNDERLWEEAQSAKVYIQKELDRRAGR